MALSMCALAAAMFVVHEDVDAGTILITSSSFDSTEQLGNFEGTIEYNSDSVSSTTGTLIITLTNTTDSSIGGWLTGLLFDVATTDSSFSATLLNSPAPTHPFQTCTGGGLKGEPYGNPYDGGAALSGSYLGGGSPTAGIAVGDTGVFHFQINAADAGSLDAIDFLEGGDYEFNFIVRFKGMDVGEGSDKVPARLVPLPAPALMGAAGLLIVLVGTRRLRRTC